MSQSVEPYQATAVVGDSATCPGGQCQFTFPTVAAGKRLLITSVSAQLGRGLSSPIPTPMTRNGPCSRTIDPAPAPTEPTELRYQPHLPLPEPSTLFDKVRRVAFIMMISQLVPLVLTLFARIASPDEPGLTTVQIILAVGCALCFFVAYFDKLFLEGDN